MLVGRLRICHRFLGSATCTKTCICIHGTSWKMAYHFGLQLVAASHKQAGHAKLTAVQAPPQFANHARAEGASPMIAAHESAVLLNTPLSTCTADIGWC